MFPSLPPCRDPEEQEKPSEAVEEYGDAALPMPSGAVESWSEQPADASVAQYTTGGFEAASENRHTHSHGRSHSHVQQHTCIQCTASESRVGIAGNVQCTVGTRMGC